MLLPDVVRTTTRRWERFVETLPEVLWHVFFLDESSPVVCDCSFLFVVLLNSGQERTAFEPDQRLRGGIGLVVIFPIWERDQLVDVL